MKSLFLLLTLTTSVLLGCSSGVKLVSNGKSDCKIFVSQNALKPEKYAAGELQKYIHQISGAALPITHELKHLQFSDCFKI